MSDLFFSNLGEKYNKAKEWKVPTVTVQWLNEVIFGSSNAEQCLHNPKYSNFRAMGGGAPTQQGGYVEEPLRIEYNLIPHLMNAWKTPIRVTPETYQKFKANPPARIKRKAERQRLEREAKRMREVEEQQQMLQQQQQQQEGVNGAQGVNQQQVNQQQPSQPPQQQPPANQETNQQGVSQPNLQQQQPEQQQEKQQQTAAAPPAASGDQSNANATPSFQETEKPKESQNQEASKEVKTDQNGSGETQEKKPQLQQAGKDGGNQDGTGNQVQEKASQQSTSEEKENRPADRAAPAPAPAAQEAKGFRLLLTGFTPSDGDRYEEMAARLGAEVVTRLEADQATHMVMPKLGRTITFLCGLPYVGHVVGHRWLSDSDREGKFLRKCL